MFYQPLTNFIENQEALQDQIAEAWTNMQYI